MSPDERSHMSIETNIRISPHEVALTVESVFGTMLGLEVREDSIALLPAEGAFAAAVSLAGSWNGSVLIECAPGQACRFAGRFLSMDPPAHVDEMVRDVLGELANMIGGNLKCVLACGVRVSMPFVLDSLEHLLHARTANLCERISFQSVEGPFCVTLIANAA